jgi:cobalt-precorrin 5A hydrolase
MKRAIIALSPEGVSVGSRLAVAWRNADLFVHEKAALPDGTPDQKRWHSFASVVHLTAKIFKKYRGLVYVMPCGVVVRAIAPHARHKKSDPAVVVVDIGARFAVSLLSGHEGGANELAQEAGHVLGAEPVISTTTEARKRFIVGVGCRRGVSARAICTAIRLALKEAGVPLSEVRTLASADIKSDERGLLSAARSLHLPLRFIRSEELRKCQRTFTRSEFVTQRVGLPAVAEPCALLAGTRTRLRQPKRIHGPVTVAVAEEDCWWWESAPADRSIAPAVPSRPSRRPRSS